MKTLKEFKNYDPHSRHKQLMNEYLQRQIKPKSHIPAAYKTEKDILTENHRFVHTDMEEDEMTWGQRVAKKYYDKLFKEYAICELKYHKEGRIALRWRTEKEVIIGKGQFVCASTRCDESKKLQSWEVNFGYMEDGEKKNELVKVRLCPECSDKLNFKTKKRLAKTLKRKSREEKDISKFKKQRKHSNASSSDSDEPDSKDDDYHNAKQDERDETSASSIWSKPLDTNEDKSKEEEYDDYFTDLLQ
ncbi:folate-sensitive fragile site protein Fra10Ac1-domain-containing protein [Parasitella parasitica]|nr:folate-sensitive fragile site protein Fra10Ac1-domain-containing protein [Parasitella parasitica]